MGVGFAANAPQRCATFSRRSPDVSLANPGRGPGGPTPGCNAALSELLRHSKE
jgi:hypothetical protein